MSKVEESTHKIPTAEDRNNYLKALIDRGLYSEYIDREKPSVPENISLVANFPEEKITSTSITVIATAEIIPSTAEARLATPEDNQFSEGQKQMLEKMENLRSLVVFKFVEDLQHNKATEKPVLLGKRSRIIKINAGELVVDYDSTSTDKNIGLYWRKILKDSFGQIIRSEEKSVQIDQDGYFQIWINTLTPSNPKGSTEAHFINKKGFLETNQKTAEAIQEVESLVNLYLQADKSRLTAIKSSIQRLFHKPS